MPLASPQSTSSPLERLPFELRLRIYQAYLDSPNLEHKEQLYQEKLKRERLASWHSWYGPNVSCGFWSPFGTATTTGGAPYGTSILWERSVGWASPALWHVGGPIAAEAKNYMFNERLKFNFTSLDLLEPTTRRFAKWLRTSAVKAVRKTFVDVIYDIEMVDIHDLRDRHHPLFKVEIRDEGTALRVLSLYRINSDQVSVWQSYLHRAFGHLNLESKELRKYDGEDIMRVVQQLLRYMENHDPVVHAPFELDEPIIWQVCLGPEDIDEPMKEGMKFNLSERLKRPSIYRHVVAELGLEST